MACVFRDVLYLSHLSCLCCSRLGVARSVGVMTPEQEERLWFWVSMMALTIIVWVIYCVFRGRS